MASIRHVGDYQLTAHITPNDGRFASEILVSRPGGLTLYRYDLPVAAFADRRAAYDYARQWMAACTVSADGRLSNDSLHASHAA
ncbi:MULTISPECIES: hypothetical protein [unclassified Xanthomonas]|uniref:hypothetical protein n=1 Tax=unclassified Xanthomonas TaxID=2643310 RepID=UPI00161BEC85|nr:MULTISPECIES: hypothetical protein [unclassified Xanthomonas]MBB4131353.1 hypothetical protein [Xanthomonas sp. 3075]MBB5865193.1 hypothetical protein [Xanthomonas sp. 3058]